MGRKCLSCGYERQETDVAPEYECPRCQRVYAKVEAAFRQYFFDPTGLVQRTVHNGFFHHGSGIAFDAHFPY